MEDWNVALYILYPGESHGWVSRPLEHIGFERNLDEISSGDLVPIIELPSPVSIASVLTRMRS